MKDSMIRRLQRVVTVLAPVALLLTSQPLSAQSRGQNCSNLVINHSFAGAFEGFLNVPAYLGVYAPPGVGIVPNAGLEFITFLPQGRVKGQLTIAVGLMGLMRDVTFDGTSTYSLSWDTTKTPASCSGTLTVSVPGLPSNFQLLVTEDGQRIEQIHTDAGLIVGVTGYRVETSRCGNNSLNGKYPYNIKGWALADPSVPAYQLLSGYFPFAFSGVMEFQPRSSTPGSGSVEGWDTLSANGTIIPRSYTGSYQVNRDCTGTMVLKDAVTSQGFDLELFVDKSGGAVHMVNVDTITIPGSPSPVPLFVLGATLNPANGN